MTDEICTGLDDGEWQGDSPVPDGTPFIGMVMEQRSLTAGAFPLKPPRDWFQNPRLRRLSPLTITADGRVSGHIASWRQTHIGMAGSVRAPKNRSGYAFFRTGVVETQEGDLIEVGQISATGGHAPLASTVSDTVAHYDNTASAFCDVNIGEDTHGIWVAGGLRPDVQDETLRTVRASSVSGDWRPIQGSLELVAICSVSVPGFPIPRARVASGIPTALVAAGTAELVHAAADLTPEDLATLDISPEDLDTLSRLSNTLDTHTQASAEDQTTLVPFDAAARIERLERQMLGEAATRRHRLDDAVLAAAVQVRRELDAEQAAHDLRARMAPARQEVAARQADTLRARVAAGSTPEPDPRIAELRARVAAADTTPAPDEAPEDLIAELRARVGATSTPEEAAEAQADVDEAIDLAAQLRARVGTSPDPAPDPAPAEDESVMAAAPVVKIKGEKSAKSGKGGGSDKGSDRDPDGTPHVGNRKGHALDNETYGISSCADVERAVKGSQNPGDYEFSTVRAHIVKRAKDLGCVKHLPPEWQEESAKAGKEPQAPVQADAADPVLARGTDQWTDKARATAAKKGQAMKSGAFPVADKADLKKAVQAYGRAKPGEKAAVRRHLLKRARALKAMDLIPDDWK